MKRPKHLAKIVAGGTGVAAVAVTAFLVATPAQATSGPAGAYALKAEGPISLPAISQVEVQPGGEPQKKSLLTVPPNPILAAGVLNAKAGPGWARASTVDLKLLKAGLSAEVVEAACKNGRGVTHLVDVKLGGQRLAVTPAPNSTVTTRAGDLGVVEVTLNKQVRNVDGTLKVTAIEVKLPLGPGKSETVEVSTATCGTVASDPGDGDDGDNGGDNGGGDTTPPGQAPAPQPVPGNLPVAG